MATTKVRDGRLRQGRVDDQAEDTRTGRRGVAVGAVPWVRLDGEPEGGPRFKCWDCEGRLLRGVPDDIARKLYKKLSRKAPEDRAYD